MQDIKKINNIIKLTYNATSNDAKTLHFKVQSIWNRRRIQKIQE